MSDEAPPVAAAGWYPDPSGSHRYWNGSAWTGQELAPGQATLVKPDRGPDITAGEVVFSILLPLIGFIWGLMALSERPRAGWQMIAVSVVTAVIAYALFVG